MAALSAPERGPEGPVASGVGLGGSLGWGALGEWLCCSDCGAPCALGCPSLVDGGGARSIACFCPAIYAVVIVEYSLGYTLALTPRGTLCFHLVQSSGWCSGVSF
ncbi:hypothetical protein apy_09240 [Aeropyrum pernix]|uniref:Uncharacterized protein n=1 Tax=Aeropyrum pernix TaxID=56636 RepID=A0A401HA50_AERPX|nr:hypothetical protein apy_09240 [Aeropyrum pernix]